VFCVALFHGTKPFFSGGRNISGTNIVFPNGSIDPWHALGVLETESGSGNEAIYIDGTAHW
jgi:serine protease 16